VEFWGDELDSIRTYDSTCQRSIDKVDQFELTPAREHRWGEKSATLQDYLGESLVVFDDLLALEDRLVAIGGSIEAPLQALYLTAQPIEELSEVKRVDDQVQFSAMDTQFEAVRWGHPFAGLGDNPIQSAFDEGLQVEFVCDSDSDEERLRSMVEDPQNVTRGYLSSGFIEGQRAVIPMAQITGHQKIRRQRQRSAVHSTSVEYLELTPGDVVVHLQNGLGKFLGIKTQTTPGGQEIECLEIQYAEGGTLFVPMTQAHLVTKYIGAHEEAPKLHALGSRIWARTRAKTEIAVQDYAKELIKLHAERTVAGGFAHPPDSEMMRHFESDFPFVETVDQLHAIAQVKADMEASESMDRLICGDVGYGKTEVAMRAAFKAVADGGRQVAVLVPTTVLAMQHYDSFRERMANYPVTVGILSRFGTAKQNRETREGVASGTIDILVGTHRILSKDVNFKRLGLVIIDEEQRFGVRVKEKLRAIRKGVDSLSLSATPIPRTLYMALLGARHLSTINTPPHDRLPIKTILAEKQEDQIRNAILRELARDGQAFYIHNRVETIYDVASDLQKLVPQARILVGHGQMASDSLDRVFHDFKRGEADILVATTIVENGVDIPRANTIFVDRAHTFGLAELYQLRGRVGRWNRPSYAYFLTPHRRQLPEIAQKRLQVLEEIGGYGGGMKVAMRDLEIRGAGNILGTEQSGHVSAIGFHFYCRLLKRAVKQLQGQKVATLSETRVEFPFDARLPEEYIEEPTLRMEFYQRFGEAEELADVEELYAELQDRFGPPPEPAKWLYHTMRLRVLAAQEGIRSLTLRKHTLEIDRKGEKRRVMLTRPSTPEDLEAQIASLFL
jgi:transcription-repair coupling factor (superfamily II helicase)